MSRLIDADELKAVYISSEIEGFEKMMVPVKVAIQNIDDMPTVDAVPVVRCKDCKHRPTGTSRDDLEFPDDECPCQCEDYWYSWKPSDNWFCGNGERKDGDGNGL